MLTTDFLFSVNYIRIKLLNISIDLFVLYIMQLAVQGCLQDLFFQSECPVAILVYGMIIVQASTTFCITKLIIMSVHQY